MSLVSVILPTYNRAHFLGEAFASIDAQTFTDWDLVVVDDGSTDDTEAVVRRLAARASRPVQYVRQANQGAYGARNTGLDHARAPLVAFFDSDDLWLPHHLAQSVAELERHADVDWVYSACQRVDQAGTVVDRTTFEVRGVARPFTHLRVERRGALNVIGDPGVVEAQLMHGLYCGLQNSVIRRRVFADDRFFSDSRVVEDVMFVLRALLRGVRLAYLTDVHVIYRIHDANSTVQNPDNDAAIFRESIFGLERLQRNASMTPPQARALRTALARHYFWHLGYVTLWQHGQPEPGLAAMAKGLRLTPADVRMWKTYVASRLRHLAGYPRNGN